MSWSVWLLLAGCAPTRPQDSSRLGTADDDDDDNADAEPVRVVTWNVEVLGQADTEQFEAVRAVLARLDADVVALNEIDAGEEDDLEDLADALDYDAVVVADSNPFGGVHNAILTRLEVVDSEIHTSEDLSDDPDANDLTRWPVSVVVETPSGRLAVVGQHWKSGFENIDEFRRVVDSIRTAQAVRRHNVDAILVAGDVNAELDDEPPSIDTWEYTPTGAPSNFELGEDLQDLLDSEGIPNDVFLPMAEAELEVVDALQLDGRDGTREESGRRIDHFFASDSIEIVDAEVYDARDEGMGGVDKAGEAPDRYATLDASDHFPVLVDVIP